MRKIDLNFNKRLNTKVNIMIFSEGTILKPKSLFSLYNHNAYVPIGNAVELIKSWNQQRTKIIFCKSRKKRQVNDMANLLRKYGFMGDFLAFREGKESYADVVEMIQPNILIEDDCKSIGGAWQMCITKVPPQVKAKIKSIVVPEIKGIDKLPNDINLLKCY